MRRLVDLLKYIWCFYYEGFSRMDVGKELWLIIFIKLLLFFVIMRWLFFPDFLTSNFDNDSDRSNFVLQELIRDVNKTHIGGGMDCRFTHD